MKLQEHPEFQYLNLLNDILNNGVRKVDRGTGDASYSVFGRQIRFDLSGGTLPLLTTKKVYWKGVLHELYWFLSGQSNIRYLINNNVHIWDDYPYKIYLEKNQKSKIKNQKNLTKDEFVKRIGEDRKFAQEWGELPMIYGQQWRRWPTRKKGRTIDQVRWILKELYEDPNAHNLIVNSWNPEYLYTMAEENDASRFPICHNMYQINVINGKLSLQLYQRSADVFLGVPFNIASYSLLTHIFAHISGYEPGEFIHTFGDVHIYETHREQVKEQLARNPYPFPTVQFTSSFKTVDEFKPEFVNLISYNAHPPIKAPLSVSGGYFSQKKSK